MTEKLVDDSRIWLWAAANDFNHDNPLGQLRTSSNIYRKRLAYRM
jgi:hypothetical protein